MAHAGTPTGLAQQAGAAQPWKTVLAAIAVLAIGLALVIAVMFVNSRAVAPATGRDDGMIEAQRDATLMSGANSKIFVGGTSANGTEGAAAAAARAGVPAVIDESYNTSGGVRGLAPAIGRNDAQIEAQRDATLSAGTKALTVPVMDQSYNTSEGVRGLAPATGTKLDATSVDRKYQEIQSRRPHGPR